MSSNKYVIDYQAHLGQGSNADVFLGLDTTNGCQYAFKCSRDSMRKEIGLLRKLNHENIIKFCDTFQTPGVHETVIVMEYCNKGSLEEFFKLHSGVCDNMFLLVLQCLCEGISYLRQEGIIHRDIKPGNMMVHEDYMGYIHIKIVDLGDAKATGKSITFPTLVGTAEYLHPEMYMQYTEGESERDHNINTDLWSIAVTLYESVTTTSPFLPFEYSRDDMNSINVMQYMHKNKKSGVISCVQNSADDTDLKWSESLPDDCRLSPMLNVLASKLIGNLMDLNNDHTYDYFFDEAHKILTKKRVLMFSSWTGQLQLLYLDDLTHRRVCDQILSSLCCEGQDIFVMTNLKVLDLKSSREDLCLKSLPIRGHLHYRLTDDTVLVMKRTANEMIPLRPYCIPNDCKAPSSRYDSFKHPKIYSNKLMMYIYQLHHATNYIDCQIDCYMAIGEIFNQYIIMNMELVNKSSIWKINALRNQCVMMSDILEMATKTIESSQSFEGCRDNITANEREIVELRGKITEGEQCLEQYYDTIAVKRGLSNYFKELFKYDPMSDPIDWLVHLAEELVSEVKMMIDDTMFGDEDYYKLTIWSRHLSQYQYYQMAKEKLELKMSSIRNVHSLFNKWVLTSVDTIKRTEQLLKFLERQSQKGRNIDEKFLIMKEMFNNLFPHMEKSEMAETLNDSGMMKQRSIKNSILEIQSMVERIMVMYHISD